MSSPDNRQSFESAEKPKGIDIIEGYVSQVEHVLSGNPKYLRFQSSWQDKTYAGLDDDPDRQQAYLMELIDLVDEIHLQDEAIAADLNDVFTYFEEIPSDLLEEIDPDASLPSYLNRGNTGNITGYMEFLRDYNDRELDSFAA